MLTTSALGVASEFVDGEAAESVTFEFSVSGDAGGVGLAITQPSKSPDIAEVSLGELSRGKRFPRTAPCGPFDGKASSGDGVAPRARPSVVANESPEGGTSLPMGERKVVVVAAAAS